MQIRLKSILAILSLFPVLVLFQNCSAQNLFSASDASKSKNNGNGGTYDGKLTFAQMVPGFTCERLPAPKSILRRDLNGQWTLTVNEPEKCGAILNQNVSDVDYDNKSALLKYNGSDYGIDNTIPEASTTVLNFIDEYWVFAAADHNSSDANVGDGICANAAGLCSLKAAVEETNAHASKAQNIILPAMDTTINWSIVPRSGSSVGIYGAGMANTIIRQGGSSGLFTTPFGMGASGLFTIKDLSLRGGASNVAFGGSALNVYSSVFVKNVDFQGNLPGAGNSVIYAGVNAQHLVIEDSWIRNNTTTGIQIFAPESVTVRNTQILNNTGRGVWVDNGSWNIQIYNSYIRGNSHGVVFNKCYSGCVIDTTEITDNVSYGLEIYSPSMSLSNDVLVRNSAISWNAISSGANIKFNCDNSGEPHYLKMENSTIFRGASNPNPNCEYSTQNKNFSLSSILSMVDDSSCLDPSLGILPPVTR